MKKKEEERRRGKKRGKKGRKKKETDGRRGIRERFQYLFAAARPGVGEDAIERVIGVAMVAHVVDDFEDARRVPADRQRLLVKVEGYLEGISGDDGAGQELHVLHHGGGRRQTIILLVHLHAMDV